MILTKKSLFGFFAILILAGLTACSRGPATPSSVDTLPVSAGETSTPDVPAANAKTGTFVLTSDDVIDGGTLPAEFTCDGESATLALSWSGAPADTKSFAVIMHHAASPTDLHWYWVVYDIPASVTTLPKNVTGIGTLGANSVNNMQAYTPPCSKGPGAKTYIYTVYALSALPQFTVPASQINRVVLLDAIRDITLTSAELHVSYTWQASSTDQGAIQDPSQKGGTPPQVAINACDGKKEQDSCQFESPKGTEAGQCETVQNQLACSPMRDAMDKNQPGSQTGNLPGQKGSQAIGSQPAAKGSAYNTEQAISDKAQGMTIAFDALAFLTGDLGSDSFFPPGKVADFWGFQYLRDNDPSQMGHAGDFLTSAALNVLNTLTVEQRARLVALAENQVDAISEYGYKRFVLMEAFRRLAAGDLPAGTTRLSEDAVKEYSAELYRLDGQISYERAQVMGSLIHSLDASQQAYMDAMVGKGMLEWPDVVEPSDMRGLDREVKVAVMTYAGDIFSWYAGSVDADVYFCPERHGTYFGSFYLKDMPAMGNPGYAIPTNLTGEMGERMLQILTAEQAQLITGLVDIQKPYLQRIVGTRTDISTELRKYMAGSSSDSTTVLSLMENYGELDGEIIYNFAVNFVRVSQSLTSEQKTQLMALREEMLGDLMYPSGAFLYSQPIPMPEIPDTDFLFE